VRKKRSIIEQRAAKLERLRSPEECNCDAERVLEALEFRGEGEGADVKTLARETGLPTSAVAAHLTLLRVAGLVHRCEGGCQEWLADYYVAFPVAVGADALRNKPS